MFFRASVRRAAVLPPVWLGRGAGALRQAQGEREAEIELPAAVLPSPVTGKPGPVALPPAVPAQATLARARTAPAARLALPKASEMETRAAQWRSGASTGSARTDQADVLPVVGEDGKAFCWRCDARVPTWFSRDCISGDCTLRKAGL